MTALIILIPCLRVTVFVLTAAWEAFRRGLNARVDGHRLDAAGQNLAAHLPELLRYIIGLYEVHPTWANCCGLSIITFPTQSAVPPDDVRLTPRTVSCKYHAGQDSSQPDKEIQAVQVCRIFMEPVWLAW